MKKIISISSLILMVLSAQLMAGAILSPGTYDEKKLTTRLDHEVLKASSDWKMGQGEPPIGPGKSAELALAAQKIQFPDFKDSAVREVDLVSSSIGCYYRVIISQNFDQNPAAATAGSFKPNQMSYYVLLDSSVIKPEVRKE